MANLGDTIRQLRKQQGLTQRELAQLTGFKQNTISNHENGNRQLDERDIRTYATALGVTPQTLFEGTSTPVMDQLPKKVPDQLTQQINAKLAQLTLSRQKAILAIATDQLEAQAAKQKEDSQQELIAYQVYERLSAGPGSNYYEEHHYDTVYYDEDISHDLASWIYGDSMAPAYLNGEVALIKDTGFDYDGAVYAIDWAGQTYIKKVYQEKEGLRLVSLNKKYAPLFAHRDENPRIIGKVIGHFLPIDG